MEAVDFRNASDSVPTENISSIDRPHRIALSWIYELPFGRNRAIGAHLPAPVEFFAGGW